MTDLPITDNDHQLTLLLADDHQILRQGLKQLLETRPELTVTSEASNGEEAVLQALSHKPDVILMDINMPKLNGLDASKAILTAWPDANIIIFSNQDDPQVVKKATELNIRGFILKDVELDTLVKAIYKAKTGQSTPLSNDLQESLTSKSPQQNLSEPLTSREQDVLTALAKGLSNQAIADNLCVSPKTVHNHLYNIYGKLGINTRAEAIVWALENHV